MGICVRVRVRSVSFESVSTRRDSQYDLILKCPCVCRCVCVQVCVLEGGYVCVHALCVCMSYCVCLCVCVFGNGVMCVCVHGLLSFCVSVSVFTE